MGYVMFSDSHGLETQWQWTAWVAVLVLLPIISTAVLSSGAAAVAILKRRAGTISLLLGLAVLFDSVSKVEYPVPTSGAIVITGASSGIGRSAAEALTKKGFTVWAGVRKESDAADIRATASTLSGPGTLKPLIIDVAKSETIESAAAEVAAAGEPLVALINNAGIGEGGPVELVPREMVERVYRVNVIGVIETTQQFLPQIRAAKGRIVNIGSLAGDLGSFPANAVYTSSKHAVEAISDATRNELGQFGVSVSLIKPGAIQTRIFNKALNTVLPEGKELKSTSAATLADKALQKLRGSDEVKELYRPLTEILFRAVRAMDTDPSIPTTELTDTTIIHAVTSPFPKTRYWVGPDANILMTLDHWLPDRVFDSFINWLYFQGGWRNLWKEE